MVRNIFGYHEALKAKHCWALSTNFLYKTQRLAMMFGQKNKNKKFKSSRLLEGDGIESRLLYKIFSTLCTETTVFNPQLYFFG